MFLISTSKLSLIYQVHTVHNGVLGTHFPPPCVRCVCETMLGNLLCHVVATRQWLSGYYSWAKQLSRSSDTQQQPFYEKSFQGVCVSE